MDFKQYQDAALKTSMYPSGGILGLCYTTLGLNGEAGEVAERIKKIIRDDEVSSDNSTLKKVIEDRKTEIVKELGDVLWYLSSLCTELGTDLNEVAQANLDKLRSRMDRGVIKGSGDNR